MKHLKKPTDKAKVLQLQDTVKNLRELYQNEMTYQLNQRIQFAEKIAMTLAKRISVRYSDEY